MENLIFLLGLEMFAKGLYLINRNFNKLEGVYGYLTSMEILKHVCNNNLVRNGQKIQNYLTTLSFCRCFINDTQVDFVLSKQVLSFYVNFVALHT